MCPIRRMFVHVARQQCTNEDAGYESRDLFSVWYYLCNNTTVFCAWSVRRLYNENDTSRSVQTRVEAGSNTSTVTLRVVGSDEKGSLESETVKYGLKSQETRIRERLRWQGPAAHTKDRPDLSSERAPHKNKTVTVTQVIKIWS
jgi:hypothetical protein